MTVATFLGRDDYVNEIRDPFWLRKEDRVALTEIIIDMCQRTAMFPAVRDHLDAVLTELGVAEAREQVWPEKSEIVRRAHGYSADTLPIRMSEDELVAVLTLPTLSQTLRRQLGGLAEKK